MRSNSSQPHKVTSLPMSLSPNSPHVCVRVVNLFTRGIAGAFAARKEMEKKILSYNFFIIQIF